jgi:adenylate cyclase
VARVRLILALEAVGVPGDRLAAVVKQGKVSFDFVDLLMPDTVPLVSETQAQLAMRSRISPWLLQAMRAVLGTVCASGEEQVRSDDVRVVELAERAHGMGALDEQIARMLRVTADSARRLVAAQRDFIDEVVLASALREAASELEAVRETAAIRIEYRRIGIELFRCSICTVEVAVSRAWWRWRSAAWRARACRRRRQPFTGDRLRRRERFHAHDAEPGDAVAAEREALAARAGGRGRPWRNDRETLGDGAMVRFPDAALSVAAMLELRRRAGCEALPPVHIGIDSGPLVRRDGDVFGTVVNLAARAASHAGPGEVLVTRAVVSAWIGGEVRFEEVGEVELRGLARPVPLYRAEPAGEP